MQGSPFPVLMEQASVRAASVVKVGYYRSFRTIAPIARESARKGVVIRNPLHEKPFKMRRRNGKEASKAAESDPARGGLGGRRMRIA